MRRILFLVVAAGGLACGGSSNSSGGNGGTQPANTTPAIALNPANASFNAVAGAASPAAASVAVTNAGTGALSGLALGTITYGAGQTTGWLASTISGSSAPSTVTLTPTTGTLLAGTYTASVPVTSATSGVANSPQTISVTLTVTAGTAAKLVFGQQPTTTNGGNITPAVTVAIEDALGNIATSSNASVTIAIGANAAGGTLAGTTTASAVAGVATFSNLSIVKAGTGYTLVASAAGLTGATSSAFNVTAITANTTLATGQSSTFVNSPNFSATLAVQPGSQYLVAVVNTDATATTTENFSLTGSFASSSSSAAALRVAGTPAQPLAVPAGARSGQTFEYNGPSLAMLRQSAQFHSAVLEHDRQVVASFGSAGDVWARARSANVSAARQANVSAAISQTIGTVNKVYVLNNGNGNCTTVDSIGARTVAVGQHVIVLADTNLTKWPQSFRPDTSFYQTFANEYDQITWPHLLTNIGDPLLYDASLSSIGKVTVTITPTLNNFHVAGATGTVVAFVNSCDFFPYQATGSNADFSNQTEMFYSLVPSSTGYTVATWENEIRATAAHETKHIVSFATRIKNNAPFELIWLEEGLAQESSEIWERNFNLATWKGNVGFFQTVDCEITIGNETGSCDPNGTKPFALTGSHLPFLFQYLQTESLSNGEGLGLDTPSNYGAGWEFARWATDQYAGSSEGPFIKSLITEPALTGVANIAAHTGQSAPLLLTYWNVATATFQNPKYVAADVRTTIPSFNFANIDSVAQTSFTCNGVRCGIFGVNSSPTPTFPVSPIAVSTTASFSKVVSGVPGTSASYFLLTGTTGGIETLTLLSSGGTALPSTSGFRVLILRVQ
jgi:hypothetical protein